MNFHTEAMTGAVTETVSVSVFFDDPPGERIRFFPHAEIVHFDHMSAAMRYGDERVALCLRRQHDLFRERRGAGRARVFMAVRVVGAGLRAAWYSTRAAAGGGRAQAYRDMQPEVVATFRTLRSMLAGGR